MSENESAVSYIQYFVTSTGGFYCQCPDQVAATAHALGIGDYPMINSADSAGADDLALLQHQNWWPQFISSAVSTALNHSYSGYNFDFEGTGSGTAPSNTSANYAHFLWDFANASHAHGLRVTVDVGWFAPQLWNATFLSATSVDVFYDMDYYDWSLFWDRLNKDLKGFPRDRLGEGLAGDTGAGNPCPGDVGLGGFAQRIHILESYNITHTAFWAMADWAVGNGCWDYPSRVGAILHDFLYNGSVTDNWTVAMGNAPDGWAFCSGSFTVVGDPPKETCPSSTSNGMNVTLYTANYTGSTASVNVEGNETVTRTWQSPLSRLTLTLWEYLDDRNVTVNAKSLACKGGSVVTSQTIPSGIGWFHGTLNLTFPSGEVCGLRLELSTVKKGPNLGENDWFANVAISFPPPLSVLVNSSVSSGPIPLGVQFHSSVSGGSPPYAYQWSFGDGNISNLSAPFHIFESVNGFRVRLDVTDGVGDHQNASVTISTLAPLPLKVAASASTLSGPSPLKITFSASPTGGTGSYVSFFWVFGDNQNANGRNTTHTYVDAGSYEVEISVKDNYGDAGHAFLNVSVTSAAPHSPAPSNSTASTPLWVYGIALSLVVIGICLAAVRIRSRRLKGIPDAEAQQEDG